MTVMKQLINAGAVYEEGHYVYKSRKHGDKYIDLDRIFPNFLLTQMIGQKLAKPFIFKRPRQGYRPIEVVAAPAVGGIALAYQAAHYFWAQGDSVDVVWADKTDSLSGFDFERAGFAAAVKGKNVLVVEDILNTGGSVAGVCQAVETHGGTVAGVSVVVNRGLTTADQLNVPVLRAIDVVEFAAYDRNDCPFCGEGRPIAADIGHGDEFQLNNPDYAGGYVLEAA